MKETLPEVWLRGKLEDTPAIWQPVAHALLQALEEITELMKDFPDHLLWERPAGVASPGFHLLHMAGVLDRLRTYAADKPLSKAQLAYLGNENLSLQSSATNLVEAVRQQVQQTIEYLKTLDESQFGDRRTVGRKKLPSTIHGLLFHAAEHTMRHLGQLLVTVRIVKGSADT